MGAGPISQKLRFLEHYLRRRHLAGPVTADLAHAADVIAALLPTIEALENRPVPAHYREPPLRLVQGGRP